jgi:hypothetical protein
MLLLTWLIDASVNLRPEGDSHTLYIHEVEVTHCALPAFDF